MKATTTDPDAPVLCVATDYDFCPNSYINQFDAGMNEHLTKPVDTVQLYRTLVKYKK